MAMLNNQRVVTGYDCNILQIWVNYNNSLTWIKAIWGYFPLLTMIPGLGRTGFGRATETTVQRSPQDTTGLVQSIIHVAGLPPGPDMFEQTDLRTLDVQGHQFLGKTQT